MRIRPIAMMLASTVVGLVLVLAPSAAAHDDDPSTTTTALPGSVAIGDGFAFTGAVIRSADGSVERTLNAYQAAVFVQSWLADAFFGTPNVQNPPPTLPVYRIDVTGTWGQLSGALTVYYASDGKTAWLSFPQDQVPTANPTSPPPPTNWFVPPTRVIEAFNGTATLQATIGTDTPQSKRAGRSSSTSRIIWAVVAALAVCGVASAAVRAFRRVGPRRAARA